MSFVDLIGGNRPLTMAAPLRFPRWVEAIIVLILLAPLVLAVLPFEDARFFVVAISICLAAPLAGLWLGEKRGRTIETRAGLGCLVTLGFFLFYGLWTYVVSSHLMGLLFE